MTDTTAGGAAPAEEAPPAEGMRKLDEAVGGGEVPIGPLGGPAPKTRERMIAEDEVKQEMQDREAIDAAKEEVKAELAEEAGGGTAPAA